MNTYIIWFSHMQKCSSNILFRERERTKKKLIKKSNEIVLFSNGVGLNELKTNNKQHKIANTPNHDNEIYILHHCPNHNSFFVHAA